MLHSHQRNLVAAYTGRYCNMNQYKHVQGMSLEQLAAGAACAADLADEIDALHSATTTDNTSASARVQVRACTCMHFMAYFLCPVLLGV
jgi:pyridoxine 5'-phosphate synthase PdxJ